MSARAREAEAATERAGRGLGGGPGAWAPGLGPSHRHPSGNHARSERLASPCGLLCFLCLSLTVSEWRVEGIISDPGALPRR